MTTSPSRKRAFASAVLLLMVLSATAIPATSGRAAADEIPHENYDLAGSDLDVVVMILNSSIRYSERALMCMYNQTMAYAEQNLSAVRNILVPAEALLEDIEDVASSYQGLSALIPPFAELSELMDVFADDEAVLIEIRADLVDASKLLVLTGDELVAALDSIKRFNEVIAKMRSSVDYMLEAAQDITDLTVADERPFAENSLEPLIEKLEDLLTTLDQDLSRIVDQDLPLDEAEPFLLLWISSPSYYLGDAIIGGGYLFFNGDFASGYAVRILLDGSSLTSATTSAGGKFQFSYEIPLDISWVGDHAVSADCVTPVGTLESEVLPIMISLIPTVVTLRLDASSVSILESVTASVALEDIRGDPIESAACRFMVDGEALAFGTDLNGMANHTWQAAQLGYGKHSFRAHYDGEVPYAPNASAVKAVTVDIPTSVHLRLFSTEVRLGQYIVGNGTLWANGTERLSNQKISLFVDGVLSVNVTTDADGGFAFTISSEDMTGGAHTLRAALLDRDLIYRYSQDEEGFTVKTYEEGEYPFWPIIPGWGRLPSDFVPYLFIGENAYFFWLLLLAFAGVSVRVLQMRKRAAATAACRRLEELEPIDSGLRVSGDAAVPPEGAFELPSPTEGPSSPNERIVWHYQRLMALLIRKGWPGLRASMTHREVARTLKAWGYPKEPVEEATMLFERALYSGVTMTDEDAVHMSAAMTSLVRPGGRRVVPDAG